MPHSHSKTCNVTYDIFALLLLYNFCAASKLTSESSSVNYSPERLFFKPDNLATLRSGIHFNLVI